MQAHNSPRYLDVYNHVEDLAVHTRTFKTQPPLHMPTETDIDASTGFVNSTDLWKSEGNDSMLRLASFPQPLQPVSHTCFPDTFQQTSYTTEIDLAAVQARAPNLTMHGSWDVLGMYKIS